MQFKIFNDGAPRRGSRRDRLTMNDRYRIPRDINQQLNHWHRGALFLQTIYVGLGITSVMSSVLLATFLDDLGNFWSKTLAATSAASVALIETTGVGRQGNGFRRAYHHLKVATIRYREQEITMQGLTQALEEAEGMIGDVEIKIRDVPRDLER